MALDDKIQSKRIGSYQNSYILKNRVNVQVFKNIYKKTPVHETDETLCKVTNSG